MNFIYAFSELSLKRGRSIAAIMSVAISISLFLSLQSYSNGYEKAARAPLSQIGADIIAQREGSVPDEFQGIVFPHSSGPLHRDEINTIKELPGVEDTSEGVFFWSFEKDNFLIGLGFDPKLNVGPGRLRAGVKAGRFLEPDEHGTAIADESYAKQKNLAVGNNVILSGKTFIIVGIVDTSRAGQVANANIYINLKDAQQLSSSAKNVLITNDFRSDDANILFIKADPSNAPKLAENIKNLLGQKAIVTTPKSFDDVLGATFILIDRFGLFVSIACLVIAAVALLRIAISNVTERRRDIALMRAVGWKKNDVRGQIFLEACSLSLLGGVLGIMIAQLVCFTLKSSKVTVPVPWELSPSPHFLPGGAKELSVVVQLDAQFTIIMAGLSILLALLIGGAVSWLTANRALNIKPAEVWRID